MASKGKQVVDEENVTGAMMQLALDQSRWQKMVGVLQRYPLLFTVLFLFIFPFIVPYQALATEIIIWGLFALGYNVCLGYTGMLSFGHAAYFGVGAYATGIVLIRLWENVWFGLFCGLLMGAVAAFILDICALNAAAFILRC